jgi:hypothetical protein
VNVIPNFSASSVAKAEDSCSTSASSAAVTAVRRKSASPDRIVELLVLHDVAAVSEEEVP